jgi:hypothetical protein
MPLRLRLLVEVSYVCFRRSCVYVFRHVMCFMRFGSFMCLCAYASMMPCVCAIETRIECVRVCVCLCG